MLKGKLKIARDTVILFVASVWGSYEIVLGGGRPAVLTLVASLLVTPIVMRVDEARRIERQANGK